MRTSLLRTLIALFILSGCGVSDVSVIGAGSPEGDVTRALGGWGERVWLAPNVGAPDLRTLFTEPEAWPMSRRRVGVFQLYHGQLHATDDAQCRHCEGNVRPNLVAAGAFDRLREWGMKIAMEAGAVKHHTCSGERAAEVVADAIAQVESSGGWVDYIAMDEPYIGGEMVAGDGSSCRYSRDQSADETARYVARLRELEPGVQVGDIEPYPYYRVPQLIGWVDALHARGVQLAFFHLDVDRNHVRQIRADLIGDLRRLRQAMSDRGIPFGVIFNAHEIEVPAGPNEDRVHHEAVMRAVHDAARSIGSPDHAIFQSWFRRDDRNVVPRLLPEAGWGMTRTVKDGSDVLWPGFDAADAARVKVERAYLGILGREADPGGAAAWANAMRHGMTTAQLCRGLFDSDEFAHDRAHLSPHELAAELYRGLLGREGDEGGLMHTAEEISAGRRAERAAAMLDSPEFAATFLQ